MRKASFFMPIMAIIAGVAGFFIRRHEHVHVFDPITELARRGALSTYTLMGLTALFLLIVLIFSIVIFRRRVAPAGFENAFNTKAVGYPILFILIGLGWLWASVMHVIDLRAFGYMQMAQLYFSVLSAISAISIIFFAIEMYKSSGRKAIYALSLIPVLFMCFWLIFVYRDNAANPVVLGYAYHVLAIITSALGFYFTAGFGYGRSKHGRAAFFYLAAIFFCFVTLADDHYFMIRAIFGVIIAINVVYLFRLLRNLKSRADAID